MADGKVKRETTANGTARNAQTAEQLIQRRKNRGSEDIADWGGCDAGKLRDAVANVTRHGYALLIGYTRQQGAYTVRIVGLEGVEPDYIRPTEDIDLYLTGLALDFE